MKTKSAFFSRSLSESSLTVDDFDQFFRGMLLEAYEQRFNSVADARFYLKIQGMDLDTAITTFLLMEKMGSLTTSIVNSLFFPIGCGDVTNTFCSTIIGHEMYTPNEQRSNAIEDLQCKLAINLPKLIRLDIPGHSYVLLASEQKKEGVLGYIYQSNIAMGMEDNSFSLAAWLMDPKSNKTNLTEHLEKLKWLLDPRTSDSEKIMIYRKLFFANPIIPVREPADMEKIIHYIKNNPDFKYSIKKITPNVMIEALERMKNMDINEQSQSLDEYINNIKQTLPVLHLKM